MKKEHVMDAMDYIDPALVAAADERGRSRGRRGWVRYGLIAACLCLALAGTAGAVRLIAGFQRIDPVDRYYDEYTDRFYRGYTAYGGVDFIPLEQLSQEVLDIAAENPTATVNFPVSGREELEELTGLELPNRLILDGLVPKGFYAYMSTDSVGPTYIDYVENYQYLAEGNQVVWLEMAASLVTERMDGQLFTGSLFPEEYVTETEEYTAENGLSAIVTHAVAPECGEIGESEESEAVFAWDGVWYRIRVSCMGHSEEASAVLKQALDGFELN